MSCIIVAVADVYEQAISPAFLRCGNCYFLFGWICDKSFHQFGNFLSVAANFCRAALVADFPFVADGIVLKVYNGDFGLVVFAVPQVTLSNATLSLRLIGLTRGARFSGHLLFQM